MLKANGGKALVEQLTSEELVFSRLKETPKNASPPEMFGMSAVADPCTSLRAEILLAAGNS